MNNFDVKLINDYIAEEDRENALFLLKKGYPVQYIIGSVDFYNLDIKVNENVLIPRFETEYLVDDTIKYIKEHFSKQVNILEFGTGSGCIAIALKKNINSDVTSVDISQKALDIAKQNAINNKADITFINGDMQTFIPEQKIDILISNPPYVKRGSSVSDSIKYEPQDAIYADEDGLFYYYKILDNAPKYLNDCFIIAFEIGDNQGNIIKNYAQKIFPNANIILKSDLNNYDRYIYIISV